MYLTCLTKLPKVTKIDTTVLSSIVIPQFQLGPYGIKIEITAHASGGISSIPTGTCCGIAKNIYMKLGTSYIFRRYNDDTQTYGQTGIL